ncbi:hypothetical protein [Leisingera thetidis]|uniref:hypothetical protein n=1 Tax=Leisingera thetidis TaxID=2930199 RepID=UPI0021F7B7F7|nr:hypothetical protein [Leisingera thetidis]
MTGSNIALLSDLFQSIADRMGLKIAKQTSTQTAETRLVNGCAQLMLPGGEASRMAVAGQALAAYAELDDAAKSRFFRLLLDEYSADPDALKVAYLTWGGWPIGNRTGRLVQSRGA